MPLVLAGCDDNVTCVFTTGCRGGGSGFLGANAVLPDHGSFLLDVSPTATQVLPAGQNVAPSSPIVVVFSESMDPDSLAGVFEIVPLFGQVPGPPVANVEQALFGDGRLLGLFPAQDLAPGLYRVRFSVSLTDRPTDLTGQELSANAGQLIGLPFTIGASSSTQPQVLTTWPFDGATGTSDLTEIVAVFDRPMDETTIDEDSFGVLVEGQEPANDPPPEALVRASGNGTVEDTRVFRYRSADPFGTPDSLGAQAEIELSLSPMGNVIEDEDGEALPTQTATFQTLSLQAPLDVALLSQPADAIGLANLTAGNAEELALQVELAAGEPGDALDLFLFGTDPDANPPALVALRRSITLSGTAPILSASFTRAQIDLTATSDPADARFADGIVAMALRLRRGGSATSLRVLDVHPDVAWIQDGLLDTVPPTILAFLPEGSGITSAVSNVRDVVLAGSASEPLRSVEASTGVGTNGILPSAFSRSDGRFLAAAVSAGALPSGTTGFTAVGYDFALNPSPPVSGIHEQRGAVGPGAFAPGDTLDVEVFDARTLAPLAGATVYVHADLGDGVNFPPTSSGSTGVDGRVQLASPGAPALGALVTVERGGYDLFTFFDVTSVRISIPLEPTFVGAAQVSGSATTPDVGLESALSGFDRRVDDTRRVPELVRAYPTAPCMMQAGEIRCPFGPEPVAPDRTGAQGFFAGDFDLSEVEFLPGLLLRAFVFLAPVGPTDEGGLEDASFEIPFLLDDPSASTGSDAVELPAVLLRGDLTGGIDLFSLADDPATTGEPFVGVETLVPGVEGPLAVGLGLAFDQGFGMWSVRSAIPGAVAAGGELGVGGAIDTDLFLRCELRDASGAVAGARPRLSSLAGLGNVVVASDVPQLLAPPPGSGTGGEDFTIAFSDVIPDSVGQPGLYRVDLSDGAGRRWCLWRTDPSGAASVLVHVPDLTLAGGAGLVDGTLSCRLHAFAWPSLDEQNFFWTDAERLHERVSRSGSLSFQKP